MLESLRIGVDIDLSVIGNIDSALNLIEDLLVQFLLLLYHSSKESHVVLVPPFGRNIVQDRLSSGNKLVYHILGSSESFDGYLIREIAYLYVLHDTSNRGLIQNVPDFFDRRTRELSYLLVSFA